MPADNDEKLEPEMRLLVYLLLGLMIIGLFRDGWILRDRIKRLAETGEKAITDHSTPEAISFSDIAEEDTGDPEDY